MRLIKSLFFVFFFSHIAFAQNPCEGYFPIQEGLKFEYTSYDKSGEITTVARHEVVYFDEYDGSWEGEYKMVVEDSDGEELSASGYDVECRDGKLYIPANTLLAPGLLEKYVTMDLTVSGNGVGMPPKLEEGMELDDGFTKIEARSGDVKLLTMRFEHYNRKVVDFETVRTPAGKFDCFKVTYDLDVKIVVGKTLKVTDWYAKGIGLVKQELTNKKGKPQGSMELTKLERE